MPNGRMKLTGLPRIDAMNEIAWCYLEGFGCKKDKVSGILQACLGVYFDQPFGALRAAPAPGKYTSLMAVASVPFRSIQDLPARS